MFGTDCYDCGPRLTQCLANFIPVSASGTCPASRSCMTTGGCCGSCAGSTGACYAYTFGTTCSATPISCPDLFDALPTDETGSRPSGSCPAWRPYQTTDGCCGACRTATNLVTAYNCGSYCSTSPGPGCSSTVPGTSAPPPPSSTSSPLGLSVGGPSDDSWIIGVSVGVPIFLVLAIGLSVGGLLVSRKRKANRAKTGHAMEVTSVGILKIQPNPASPSATKPITAINAVPATAMNEVPATQAATTPVFGADGQPIINTVPAMMPTIPVFGANGQPIINTVPAMMPMTPVFGVDGKPVDDKI